MDRSITGVIAALALSAVLVGACSSPGSPASPTGASGSVGGARPSSPAVLRIVQPTDGATITGETVHVVVSLQG
ncbi:MAG TPA: hypothetical protein VFW86_06990, partial [Candidatus Limnocylindrales bacterium]|nr:hypothetical protein [Candidatus Limnocylindrales bacterium]